MNRFTSWSSTPAVGNRSSRGCFSSSIKSTSSAYSISDGIPSGEIGGFGLVELSRTDDSAAARWHVKSTGERPSPCGEPIMVSNSAECAVLTRTLNRVSASSSLTNRSSSLLQPAWWSTSRVFDRLIVSKARDMSIPILWKSQCLDMTTDTNMRWAHTMSAQLRPRLKPLWQSPVNLSVFSQIPHKVTFDSIFRMLFRSTIGLRLDGWPGGFFGLGSALLGRCVSKTELMMRVIGLDMTSLAYFRSSTLMLSGPEARPLFNAHSALSSSASLIGDCRGEPVKGCSGSSFWSVNCSLNHSCIASAFPWAVAAKSPCELCTASDGVGPAILNALCQIIIISTTNPYI